MELPYLEPLERICLFATQRELLSNPSQPFFEERVWSLMVCQVLVNGDPLYRKWSVDPELEGSFLDLVLAEIGKRPAVNSLGKVNGSLDTALQQLNPCHVTHSAIRTALYMLAKARQDENFKTYKEKLQETLQRFAEFYKR